MLPPNKINLQRIFDELDKNGDGLVSIDELMWLLERIGFYVAKRGEVELLVGKDTLGYMDFLFFYETLMLKGSNIVQENYQQDDEILERDLEQAFSVFDLNGDGFICCDELKVALSRLGLYSGQDCKNMIDSYDTNLDGLMDFHEFKFMMLCT